MILARTEYQGADLRIEVRFANGYCWLNSFRGTGWLTATNDPFMWKDGIWTTRPAVRSSGPVFTVDWVCSPAQVMTRILGTFGVLDDWNLFDAAELERLLSPESMAEIALGLEVLES